MLLRHENVIGRSTRSTGHAAQLGAGYSYFIVTKDCN